MADLLRDNPRGAQAINISIAVGVTDTLAVLVRLLARWKSKASIAADGMESRVMIKAKEEAIC